jgi:hypothetical protein
MADSTERWVAWHGRFRPLALKVPPLATAFLQPEPRQKDLVRTPDHVFRVHRRALTERGFDNFL